MNEHMLSVLRAIVLKRQEPHRIPAAAFWPSVISTHPTEHRDEQGIFRRLRVPRIRQWHSSSFAKTPRRYSGKKFHEKHRSINRPSKGH